MLEIVVDLGHVLFEAVFEGSVVDLDRLWLLLWLSLQLLLCETELCSGIVEVSLLLFEVGIILVE